MNQKSGTMEKEVEPIHFYNLKNLKIFLLEKAFFYSYDLLLDFYNSLNSGCSLVESIESKLLLIGKQNGIPEEVFMKNLSNHSKNLEKLTIALSAALSMLSKC